MLLNNKNYNAYNYYQVYYPSDRDNYLDVNHYILGYYLVNHIYKHYDNLTFSRILKNAGNFIYLFPDFYSELRKYTSNNLAEIHYKAISELEQKWQKQRSAHYPFTEVKNLTPFANKSYYQKYTHPQTDGEGNLYSIETHSKKNHATLVQHLLKSNSQSFLKNKIKQILKLPSSFARSSSSWSIGKENMVWINRLSDIRRIDVAFSEIEIFNLREKKNYKN